MAWQIQVMHVLRLINPDNRKFDNIPVPKGQKPWDQIKLKPRDRAYVNRILRTADDLVEKKDVRGLKKMFEEGIISTDYFIVKLDLAFRLRDGPMTETIIKAAPKSELMETAGPTIGKFYTDS